MEWTADSSHPNQHGTCQGSAVYHCSVKLHHARKSTSTELLYPELVERVFAIVASVYKMWPPLSNPRKAWRSCLNLGWENRISRLSGLPLDRYQISQEMIWEAASWHFSSLTLMHNRSKLCRISPICPASFFADRPIISTSKYGTTSEFSQVFHKFVTYVWCPRNGGRVNIESFLMWYN